MGAGIEAPPVSGVSSDPAFQGPFLVLNLHHSSSEAPRMPINGSDPAACFMGRGARYLRADPTRGVNLEPEQNEESNMNLTDELFQRYSDLVYQECGINLHEGKKALLQARLNKRLRATGFASYEQYYEHITSPGNSGEFIHFLDSISTNLTYFFRESQHFDFLNKRLPELLETKIKEKNPKLRIWSAGCSTGEEPYSIAMCVIPHLEGLPRIDFRILATDISTHALNTAMRGIYSEEKAGKVPEAFRSQHFRTLKNHNGRREFEVASALRDRITFGRLNLKDPFPFKGLFDFIFCRNVMIYFDKKTQEMIVHKLARYLSPGGYLLVGHSESLMGLSHSLRYVCPAVYRK